MQVKQRRETHQNRNEILGSDNFTLKFGPLCSFFSPLVLVTLGSRAALCLSQRLRMLA